MRDHSAWVPRYARRVGSRAATPEEHLTGLPEERRETVERVRDTVNANLADGFEEVMQYASPTDFRARWEATGRKLDMSKSCVRFRRLGDVALDVLGETVARTTVEGHIEVYECSRGRGCA